jgi:hypothetical protein
MIQNQHKTQENQTAKQRWRVRQPRKLQREAGS